MVQTIVQPPLPQDRETSGQTPGWLTPWQWILLALGIGVIALAIGYLPLRQMLIETIRWIEGRGIWSLLIFIAAYTLLVTLAVPVTPLNLASGVIFGAGWGFVAAMAGGAGAAMLSFILSRYLLRDWIQRRLLHNPRAAALMDGVAEDQWTLIILTRLNPILPCSLKNYVFGVTDMHWYVYLLGTILAYTPSVFLYAYLGSAGHAEVVADREWTALNITLYLIGGIVAVVLTVALACLGKRRMDALQARYRANHPGAD